MNERIKFIAAFLEGNENFTELCERFGISRKKGYKWRERYESGGLDGMKDRFRAPHHHPGAVVERVAGLIVQARRKHPSWGPVLASSGPANVKGSPRSCCESVLHSQPHWSAKVYPGADSGAGRSNTHAALLQRRKVYGMSRAVEGIVVDLD